MLALLTFGLFLLLSKSVNSDQTNRKTIWPQLQGDYKELKHPTCSSKWETPVGGCEYICDDQKEHPSKYEWFSCGGKGCNCDSKCHQFGDCCLDVATFEDVPRVPDGRAVNQKCLPVPGSPVKGSEYIFMVNKCAADWNDLGLKLLCEADLDLSHPDLNVLSYTVPVHSKTTYNFYKNYYCAVCNRDNFNLTEWILLSDNCQTDSSVKVNFENITYWNGTWILPQQNRNCTFVIQELFKFYLFEKELRARPCHPTDYYISTCSIRGSPHAKYCYNYYAPVFTAPPNFTGRESFSLDRFRVFWNLHCLLCNLGQIPENETIYCRLPPSEHPSEGYPYIRPNMVMLLDFNDNNNSTMVPRHSECKEGEVYLVGNRQCYKVHQAGKIKRTRGKPKSRPSSPK